MTNKKKSKRKFKLKGLLRLIIIIALLVFLIVKIFQWNTSDSDVTYYLSQGEINIENNYKGIVIRKEILVTSQFSGKVTQVLNDGDFVKVNQRIMDITKENESSVSEELSELQVAEPIEMSRESQENRIESIKEDIALAVKNEDYKSVSDLTTALSLTINTLKEIDAVKDRPVWVQNIEASDIEIGESMPVYASDAGILTYYIDGYEDAFTYERAPYLQFNKILEMEIIPDLAKSSEVSQGDILCKIVDGSEYYIIVVADTSEYTKYNLYSDVTIEVMGKTSKGSIEKFMAAGDQVAMAIKLTTYIDDFHKKRFIDLKLKQDSYQGLVVNTASITRKDDQLGVYVVNSLKEVIFKPIQIIYYEGDKAVVKSDLYYEFKDEENIRVETVRLHDRVIKIAENYQEGDKIK